MAPLIYGSKITHVIEKCHSLAETKNRKNYFRKLVRLELFTWDVFWIYEYDFEHF